MALLWGRRPLRELPNDEENPVNEKPSPKFHLKRLSKSSAPRLRDRRRSITGRLRPGQRRGQRVLRRGQDDGPRRLAANPGRLSLLPPATVAGRDPRCARAPASRGLRRAAAGHQIGVLHGAGLLHRLRRRRPEGPEEAHRRAEGGRYSTPYSSRRPASTLKEAARASFLGVGTVLRRETGQGLDGRLPLRYLTARGGAESHP